MGKSLAGKTVRDFSIFVAQYYNVVPIQAYMNSLKEIVNS